MDIDVVAVWKVVVDNEVDSLEVHATTHDISTDQNPHAAGPEPTHHCISLYTDTSTHNSISSKHSQTRPVPIIQVPVLVQLIHVQV